MNETVNYSDAVKRCEELHDDNRQDLKLLSLEIARLKDELSKTEGYPGIVHDLERARVMLSAAVRERDETRAECERLRDAVDGVLAWMNNEQMGQWPYMEGAGFYMDLAEHKARLDAARRAG